MNQELLDRVDRTIAIMEETLAHLMRPDTDNESERIAVALDSALQRIALIRKCDRQYIYIPPA